MFTVWFYKTTLFSVRFGMKLVKGDFPQGKRIKILIGKVFANRLIPMYIGMTLKVLHRDPVHRKVKRKLAFNILGQQIHSKKFNIFTALLQVDDGIL